VQSGIFSFFLKGFLVLLFWLSQGADFFAQLFVT